MDKIQKILDGLDYYDIMAKVCIYKDGSWQILVDAYYGNDVYGIRHFGDDNVVVLEGYSLEELFSTVGE